MDMEVTVKEEQTVEEDAAECGSMSEPLANTEKFRWNLKRMLQLYNNTGLSLSNLPSVYSYYFDETITPDRYLPDANSWETVFNEVPLLKDCFEIVTGDMERIASSYIRVRDIFDKDEIKLALNLVNFNQVAHLGTRTDDSTAGGDNCVNSLETGGSLQMPPELVPIRSQKRKHVQGEDEHPNLPPMSRSHDFSVLFLEEPKRTNHKTLVKSYNLNTKKCEVVCTLAESGRHCSTIVQVGNKLYDMGGFPNVKHQTASKNAGAIIEKATAAMSILQAGKRKPCIGPDMAAPKAGAAACFVGNKIYLVGGRYYKMGKMERQSDVQQIDLDNLDLGWMLGKPLFPARGYFDVATMENKLYVVGGNIQKPGTMEKIPSSLANVYDVNEDKWTELPPMPSPRSHHRIVVLNNSVYSMGGYGNTEYEPLRTVEEYNTETGSWRALASMKKLRASGSAFVHDRLIYVIGGDVSASFSRKPQPTGEFYDPRINEWMLLDNSYLEGLPTGIRTIFSGSVLKTWY